MVCGIGSSLRVASPRARFLVWSALAWLCATACGQDLCEHPDGLVRNERRRGFAGPSLSIVTFNMLSGGPFPGILGLPGSETIYDSTMRERLALQATGLARESPDIVVLQEVSGTTPERYCSMLDALLEGVTSAPGGEAGYNVAFARGDRDPVANRCYSGLAILSRFELRDARTYTFSVQGTFGLEERVALKVSIRGERADVDVVTTPLHSNDDGLAAALGRGVAGVDSADD